VLVDTSTGRQHPLLLLHAGVEKNRRGSEISLLADQPADIPSFLPVQAVFLASLGPNTTDAGCKRLNMLDMRAIRSSAQAP